MKKLLALLFLTGCSFQIFYYEPEDQLANNDSPYYQGESKNSGNDAGTDTGMRTMVDAESPGDPWSPCFNPLETYPTGAPKIKSCQEYCQGINKNVSNTCLGPYVDYQLQKSTILFWCGTPAGECGDIRNYPNYVPACPAIKSPVCVSSIDNDKKYNDMYCLTINGKIIQSTSAQCCCK